MCYVFAFVGLSVSPQQDNSKGVMKFFEGVGCALCSSSKGLGIDFVGAADDDADGASV